MWQAEPGLQVVEEYTGQNSTIFNVDIESIFTDNQHGPPPLQPWRAAWSLFINTAALW